MSQPIDPQAQQQTVSIKISDEMQRGTYSNRVVVGHTANEFVFDFISELPPGPVVVSRVIMSPGNAAAFIDALGENLAIYEKQHGRARKPAPAPPGANAPFKA